jgi:CheY-like chemotaxis protein
LKTSNSAASLTQRLTAFARKQVLNPRSIDLMSLVNGMQDLLEHTLGPDVRLTVSSDPLLWPALVDPNQIEMTILNLAINASDAMPRGGTLTIDATNAQFASDGPPGLAPGQYVVLTVSDSGTGMDEATLERAMEPFFTTKEPGKGTGLGLSMMQGVVSQSGGATRLHSEPGRGTQIEIWLPRAQLPPEETANRDAHMDHPDEGAVVVCDDDPEVLELLCDILSTKGYEVVSVTNGRAALSALTRNRSIRLLVVDLTMPEMNGGVVAREARIGHPHIPILIITGNANVEAIKADLPGVALLCKPFTPKQFTARIADLLETG